LGKTYRHWVPDFIKPIRRLKALHQVFFSFFARLDAPFPATPAKPKEKYLTIRPPPVYPFGHASPQPHPHHRFLFLVLV